MASYGVVSEHILKEHEGRPNITDAIKNKEIQLVINTPSGKLSKYDDSYIRKAAIKYKVPYITSLTAAMAAVRGIAAYCAGKSDCQIHSAIPCRARISKYSQTYTQTYT